MTYDPRQTFKAQQSAYSRAAGTASTKSQRKSSRSNANQQAAASMGSVGIGSVGGKTTTSAAQSIQDKFRRETQRDDDK